MKLNKEIIVVGAGPVGLSAAMLFKNLGYEISIYDKRSDPRNKNEHGRSINLALSHRGFKTLGLLHLEDKIKTDLAIPMYGRMVHDEKGNTNFQPYNADNKAIYSVSRSSLNNLLLDEAGLRGLNVVFNSKCTAYDYNNEKLLFENFEIDTKNKSILACDGAFSPVRNSLKTNPLFQHREEKLEYGYKEFTIQPVNGDWAMEKNSLHIWPRKDFMLIALPNTDKSFTCTLFLKLKGDDSFQDLATPALAKEFFNKHFKDAIELLKDFENEVIQNPESHLFMETCFPWNKEDKVLLLGDAAHAIVPFYGQGLNAGLEDVRILTSEMSEGNDLQETFHNFQQKRKKDTDAIAELALQNFIEMRDLVSDPIFLLKKKVESKIKKLYKDKWNTQYELVTFSSVPYTEAWNKGRENNDKISMILENEGLCARLLDDKLTEHDNIVLSSLIL